MEAIITHFHFLRPLWLLAIPVVLLLTYWLSRQGQRNTGFESLIAPELLAHLRAPNESKDSSGTHRRFLSIYALLAIAWVIVCLALAGPTWQQLPQPLQKSDQALVIVLDLSPSMRAQDNKPSRIVRARLKIKDLLSQRRDGLTALVAYAGEAHVVTPLTDDINTIDNLLSTLEPGLLPIPGSNIEMALQTATQLTRDAAIQQASYVVLTDGIDESAVDTLAAIANDSPNHSFFFIGLGTRTGAPIPTQSSDASSGDRTDSGKTNSSTNFLRDGNGAIVNAVRNDEVLNQVAAATKGYYLPLQATDTDIDFIIDRMKQSSQPVTDNANTTQRTMDRWDEFGPTLLLLFLPLFALMFRRGWLLCLCLLLVPMMHPQAVYADKDTTPSSSSIWDRLWLNDQQRAKKAFDQQQFDDAEQLFDKSDHQWQGSAAYKNKNYQAAVEAFAQGDSATDDYNRGNALSQLQQFDEAIAAYDSALAKDPSLTDAKKNRELVQQLQAQQQQQQNGDGDDSEKNSSDEKQANDSSSQQTDHSSQQADNSSQQADGSSQEADGSSQQADGSSQKETENISAEQQAKSDDDTEHQSALEQDNQQNDEENNNADVRNAKKSENENSDGENGNHTQAITAFDQLSREEQQELEQWIQKIPDDPSGLLRRKFEYEFEKRRELYRSGKWQLPDNNAHERY